MSKRDVLTNIDRGGYDDSDVAKHLQAAGYIRSGKLTLNGKKLLKKLGGPSAPAYFEPAQTSEYMPPDEAGE